MNKSYFLLIMLTLLSVSISFAQDLDKHRWKERVVLVMSHTTKSKLFNRRAVVLNKDKVVSYQEIEQYVWEDEYMSLNSLRTTIGFLRKKIPFNCIKNISNMGYKLKLEN